MQQGLSRVMCMRCLALGPFYDPPKGVGADWNTRPLEKRKRQANSNTPK